VQPTLGWDCRIVAVGVREPAEADDVVADDQAAGAGALERPDEVIGRVNLVGIDEGQVEGADTLGLELGKLVESGPDAQIDELAKAGPLDVAFRDIGDMRIGLQGDETAGGGYGATQPNRAVGAEGAELEDLLRPDRLRQQVEQLALGR
jgi:hypothetical protein